MLRHIKHIGLGVLAIVSVLIVLLVVKTLTFTSKQVGVSTPVSYPIDMDQAAARLGRAIQFQTVSDTTEGQRVDWSQFTQFQQYIEKSFPLVHATLEKQIINDCGLLYMWKGSDPQKKPIFLTGHYDVKPAEGTDAGWKYPPFSGVVSDGYIWGRGADDDKDTPMGLMEATEYLIKSGYKPARSIYMGFGCDEENGGALGAAKIAEYLKSAGVQFEVIIDEGGFVTRSMIPGIAESQWVALVGTGEKGVVYLELTTETPGGHSSVPERWTSVGILAAALDKIESNPFPARWPTPTQDTFDYLGPEMSYPNKLIFANMWIFQPLVQGQLASTPFGDSLIRTVQAPNVFEGAKGIWELPSKARAFVNIRTLAGDNVTYVVNRIKALVNDPRVKIEAINDSWDAPPDSSVNTSDFQVFSKSVRQVMPNVLVAPLEGMGATDARYYGNAGLSPNIYRWTGFRLPPDETTMIHGVGERIAVDSYREVINCYIQLIRNYTGDSADLVEAKPQ